MQTSSWRKLITIIVCLLWTQFSFADDLLPATSEDIDAFDQALERQIKQVDKIEPPEKLNEPKDQRSDFKDVISKETQKIKDSRGRGSGSKNFGNWVRSQKRRDDYESKESNSGKDGSSEHSGHGGNDD